MDEGDATRQLLEQIRDAQREHLAEYKRVTARSLELQELGTARQQQVAQLYRRVVLVGGVLVAVLLCLLVYLLLRWSHRLFGM